MSRPEGHERSAAVKAIAKRQRDAYRRDSEEQHKNDPKQGEVGFYFTVRQSGGTSGRRYWVQFKVDENYHAQWVGGTKANKATMDRVNAIDWSKPTI